MGGVATRVLTGRDDRQRRWWRLRLPAFGRAAPYVALAAVLVLTAFAWHAERAGGEEARRRALDERIDLIADRLLERAAGYTEVLRGAAALFAGTDAVSAGAWRRYVAALDLAGRYPALASVGFARAPEASVQGTANGARGVTLYVEPAGAPRPEAFGDPSQRDAMARARDAGAPAASAPFASPAGGAARPRMAIYVPVYRAGAPLDTIAARRAALEGWVFGHVRLPVLAAGLTRGAPPGLVLRLHDAAAPELVVEERSDAARAAGAPLDGRRTLTVQGRPWTLAVAMPVAAASREWWVLAVGLALGALVFGIARILVDRRDRALALSGLMTEQLRRANERLEGRVAARTRALDEANAQLRAEVAERTRAERERARALAQERHARGEAEAASRAKDEFLAVLSHELRTPLNAIQGWSHILAQEGVDAGTVRHGTEIIRRNVHLQTRLIEDLLDSARIASGKLRLETRAVRFADLVAEVVDNLRPSAASKGVRLEASIGAQHAQVAGDPPRLQQVVWNLLANALKFTPPGGGIDVRLEEAGSGLRLAVSDTGSGVAPELLPYVFDRFRQADSSSRRSAGGLGLGLALVKELVELHGGTVDVASPGAGRGTTFTVTLPVRPVGDPDAGCGRAGTGAASGDAARRLAGLALLAVDDHADSLEFLRAALEQAGAAVATAASARAALARIGEGMRPDAVLCDIELPDEDGYAFLAGLRALEAARGVPSAAAIPVLAVTAYAGSGHRARALAAGFAAHVAKPIDAAALVETIRALGTG